MSDLRRLSATGELREVAVVYPEDGYIPPLTSISALLRFSQKLLAWMQGWIKIILWP